MTWYESEFGCKEGRGFAAARGAFSLNRGDDGDVTLTAVGGNNKTYHVGAFEDPSVEELRSRQAPLDVTFEVSPYSGDESHGGGASHGFARRSCCQRIWVFIARAPGHG